MITYIKFSLLFFVIHFVCYTIAGVIDLQLAKKCIPKKTYSFGLLRAWVII